MPGFGIGGGGANGFLSQIAQRFRPQEAGGITGRGNFSAAPVGRPMQSIGAFSAGPKPQPNLRSFMPMIGSSQPREMRPQMNRFKALMGGGNTNYGNNFAPNGAGTANFQRIANQYVDPVMKRRNDLVDSWNRARGRARF